jgi:gliding motility-associated-like protein
VLQRFDSLTNSWDDIVVQDLNVEMSWDFTDSDLATDVFSYSYRIVVFNACGLPVDTSNVATTILLDGEPNQERLVNTLRWSPYSQWNEGVKVYQIYRRTKTSEFELLTEINGGASLFYEDDVSELVESDGDFYYRIDAVEKTSDARDAFISKSNEVNVSIDPIIWIPNAMVIGGYNELFKPVMSFALVEEYYLVIFSKWGDMIFETYDASEGWDGSMNGRMVQEGVYNYYLTVKDGRGRAIDRFGNITVLNYE